MKYNSEVGALADKRLKEKLKEIDANDLAAKVTARYECLLFYFHSTFGSVIFLAPHIPALTPLDHHQLIAVSCVEEQAKVLCRLAPVDGPIGKQVLLPSRKLIEHHSAGLKQGAVAKPITPPKTSRVQPMLSPQKQPSES